MSFPASLTRRFREPDLRVYAALSLLLSVFLLLRALYVPPVFDEANSFFYYIQNGRFLPFLSEPDTNNHVLNSALSFLIMRLTGDTLLSLRLANLLALPFYLYFVYRLSAVVSNPWLKWVFRLSLLFTLHLVEFFALGRGYGLSFALFTAALYEQIKAGNAPGNATRIRTGLLLFAAGLANLALIYVFWLMLLWNAWLLIRLRRNGDRRRGGMLSLLPGLLLAVLLTVYIFYLRSLNELVAGNSLGFWQTSIVSLFRCLTDTFRHPELASLLAALLLLLLTATFLLFLFRKPKSAERGSSPGLLLLFLLAGNTAGIVITSLIFHINYPDERIVTLWFLMLVMALVYLADNIPPKPAQGFLPVVLSLPLLIFPLHFVWKSNLTHSVWYRNNTIPTRFYDTVSASRSDGFPATLSAYHILSLCWSARDYFGRGDQNAVTWSSFPEGGSDFMILDTLVSGPVPAGYQRTDYDEVSNTWLLKRTGVTGGQRLYERKNSGRDETTDAEFFGFLEADSLPAGGETLRIDLEAALRCERYPFTAMLVASAEDSLHQSLRYEYLRLNHLRKSWSGDPAPLSNSLVVYSLPKETRSLKIYLWNPDRLPFRIGAYQLRVSVVRK
jgi:hypothetical protein